MSFQRTESEIVCFLFLFKVFILETFMIVHCYNDFVHYFSHDFFLQFLKNHKGLYAMDFTH